MNRSQFISTYSGYNEDVERFRGDQIPSMEMPGAPVYLDYGGFAPFTKSQVESHSSALVSQQWANPHSSGCLGANVGQKIDAARKRILNMLSVGPDTHQVIFCSGATAALKLVADTFSWSSSSVFAYTLMNHNSVVGIRETALSHHARVLTLDGNFEAFSDFTRDSALNHTSNKSSNSLFAFPAECNFSGIRFPLSIASDARNGRLQSLQSSSSGRWSILLDASKYCATAKLDLSSVEADFSVISFYKMFGLPTGLGALIVRNDSAELLSNQVYFGGGALQVMTASQPFHRLHRNLASRLECGSLPFTLIDSIVAGIDLLDKQLGFGRISRHCCALTEFLASSMASMIHTNGNPVFQIFGNHFKAKYGTIQGPTVAFCVLTNAGDIIGYSHIDRLAALCGFQIRAGCFCNSGACQVFLKLSPEDVISNFERGHVCGDNIDMIDGKPTGCLRISLGYASTFSDISSWLGFAQKYFVKQDIPRPIAEAQGVAVVESIRVYPIKSCSGFAATEWSMAHYGGLLFDRGWALIDDRQNIMSQTRFRSMQNVKAKICMERGCLSVTCKSSGTVYSVPLDVAYNESEISEVRDCGRKRRIFFLSDSEAWFSDAIGVRCRLARFIKSDTTFQQSDDVLVVSKASMHSIIDQSTLAEEEWNINRFRPNFVITGTCPFMEESWKGFVVDPDLIFTKVHLCSRCTMIGGPQYSELSRIRQRPNFGVVFCYRGRLDGDEAVIRSGSIYTSI